jgi:D-alanyl-D-alanine carboxypeptidase (penicillin-binding protein 5/6)
MLHDRHTRIPVRGIMRPPYYYGTTGIKTGFTPQAGGALVASAERDGTEFITVVLGSTVDARFADSIIMLDFGFENFFTHRAVDASTAIEDVEIRRGAFNYVSVKIKEDKYVTLPKQASPMLVTTEIEIDENIMAPIEIGQVLGRVNVFEGNMLIGEIPIIATAEVAQGMFLSRFGIEDSKTMRIIKVAIVIGSIISFSVLAFIVLKIRYTLRKKAKRRKRAMEIALERQERERELKEREWPY